MNHRRNGDRDLPDVAARPPPNANSGSSQKPLMLGHCEAGLFSALKLPTGAMATATLLTVLMEEKPLAGPATVPADMTE